MVMAYPVFSNKADGLLPAPNMPKMAVSVVMATSANAAALWETENTPDADSASPRAEANVNASASTSPRLQAAKVYTIRVVQGPKSQLRAMRPSRNICKRCPSFYLNY